MAVSSCNKEVATRLFRMLAINDDTVNSVKRDAASYAKLSLLTQQMNLLTQQAQKVVEKAEVQVDEIEILSENRMVLSSEYDEGAKRLLSMITANASTVVTVSQNTASCAKLSVLAEQVGLLQEQAQQCVDDADLNRRLIELGATVPGTKLVCGTVYHHYTQNGREVLSKIASHEWTNWEVYHGTFIYDYDHTFRKHMVDGGIDVLSEALVPLKRGAERSADFVGADFSIGGGGAPNAASERMAAMTTERRVLSRW